MADIDDMTGKEMDAFLESEGIDEPKGWSSMRVAEKRKWLHAWEAETAAADEPAPVAPAPRKVARKTMPDLGERVIARRGPRIFIAEYRKDHFAPQGAFYSEPSSGGGFTVHEGKADAWAPVPVLMEIE